VPQLLAGVITHRMKVIKHHDGTVSLRATDIIMWAVVHSLEEIKDQQWIPTSYAEAIIKKLQDALM